MHRTILLNLMFLTILVACSVPTMQNPMATLSPTPWEEVAGALWVRILSPSDNEIVNVPSVEVQGEAPVDTVLSINDEILIVSSDQVFSLPVALEEGVNVIEIVASDNDGNEVSFILTVTYQP